VVPGEIIARIILKTVALLEATLGNWVEVTNVSGNVTPSLSAFGEAFCVQLGDLVETMTSLLANMMSYLG
jgi:hypothetical protein